MYNLVALMPMRHYSDRVKGKNYRPFGNGEPLFFHVLRKLENCSDIDLTVINTDSDLIISLCAEHFPNVKTIKRPEYLLGEDRSMNEILVHDAKLVPSKHYIQTHSTNPLLRTTTIKNAIATYLSNRPDFDSLFSVTKLQTRFWDAETSPLNHNPHELLRTQDLPPFFEENSCLYIFDQNTLLESKNRLGTRPFMYLMDRLEATDIDIEVEFSLAEQLYMMMGKEDA